MAPRVPSDRDMQKCLRNLRAIYRVYAQIPRARRIQRGIIDVGRNVRKLTDKR